MAAKKGKIPEHVKQKIFCNPKADHPIIEILNKVEDPRKPSLTFSYSLTSVLFMTLVATISGATDWAKIVVMSQGMETWLAQYVDMSSGVPCERTFKNIFNVIKSEALEGALQKLSELMRERISQEVISVDGQTSRGTAEKSKGNCLMGNKKPKSFRCAWVLHRKDLEVGHYDCSSIRQKDVFNCR